MCGHMLNWWAGGWEYVQMYNSECVYVGVHICHTHLSHAVRLYKWLCAESLYVRTNMCISMCLCAGCACICACVFTLGCA